MDKPLTTMYTDNGNEFKGSNPEEIQNAGAELILSSPYSSELNGCVEAVHKTLKRLIIGNVIACQQRNEIPDQFQTFVDRALREYNYNRQH